MVTLGKLGVFGCVLVLLATACMADPQAGVAPADAEAVEETTAELGAGCMDCNAIPDACMSECLVKSNGDPSTYWYIWNPCINECINTQYVPCVQARDALTPVWSYAGPTMLLCHIDPDIHLDGVTIELYTADRYVDTSCRGSADSYRKRLVQSVHCGYSSEGTCKSRVTTAIQGLVAQGYIPSLTAPDQDNCPTPRAF